MPIVNCCYCNEPFIIENIRCGIVIHAAYKKSGKQVNPHKNISEVKSLLKKNKIYGCGNSIYIKKSQSGEYYSEKNHN